MTKNCALCEYFRGYYSKTYCGFYREKLCNKNEICDNYQHRVYIPSIKRGVVIDALSDAITDINAIKTILEERELK